MCRRDVRVCHNCRFYSSAVARECREEQAGWVKDKERANFCSYFSPASAQAASPDASAKAKLAALFGEAPAQPAPKAEGLAGDLARFLSTKR